MATAPVQVVAAAPSPRETQRESRAPRLRTQTSKQRIEDYIAGLVGQKKVLDVGCVDHNAAKETEAAWLHRRLAESAASILGLDILQDDVQKLAAKGYRVTCGDATTVDLCEQFDAIVAGELIEHVDNPGQFVANMRRHLRPDGVLVLTTPNPFYALHFVEFIFSSPERRWNPEHVGWFCSFTLHNLLARHRMSPNQCIYFARSRKVRRFLNVLHLPCPRIFASTLLVVATPAANIH